MTKHWSAIGPDDSGQVWLAHMDGADLQKIEICPAGSGSGAATAVTAVAAVAAVADARVVRIAQPPPVPVPTAILPAAAIDLPDLSQATPPGRLNGWARIVVAGFLADRSDWDGVILIAGADRSHWMLISADEIVSFQSFLTGRLRRLLGGAPQGGAAGLADTLSRPEALAAQLQSAELAKDAQAISGHLIGAELAAARPYWLGQNVAVIEETSAYDKALSAQGIVAEPAAPEAMRAAGLAALGRALGLAG